MGLISVAIPARSATSYLLTAARSVLSLAAAVEVVLGLNPGSDPLGEAIEELRALQAVDSRLSLVRSDRLLSMTDNFRFTFSRLRGEWRTVIGSDDGVMPSLPALLATVESAHPEIRFVNFTRARFRWPGIKPHGKCVFVESAPTARIRETPPADLEAVITGRSGYLLLPALYNGGIVRRDLAEELGVERLFNSLSPDVSAAVALAISREPVLHVGVPAFWAGTSELSNGAAVWKDWSQHGGARSERTKEFFRLSESDGHGLAPSFSDLPAARFIVAASACTSAASSPDIGGRDRERWTLLGRYAVTSSDGGSPGRREAVRRAASCPESDRADRGAEVSRRRVRAVRLHGLLLVQDLRRLRRRIGQGRLVLGLQRRLRRLGRRDEVVPRRFTVPGTVPILMPEASDEAMRSLLSDDVRVLSARLLGGAAEGRGPISDRVGPRTVSTGSGARGGQGC